MKPGLAVGHQAELNWNIGSEHVIHLGVQQRSLRPDGRPAHATAVVFSTPNMIMLMERAARRALEPFLEEGEESVGAIVHVEHMAATPIGSKVSGLARVTAVQGRSIDFDVTAFDETEMIGRGTHRRVVVPIDKIAARVEAKAHQNVLGKVLPMSIEANTGALPKLQTIELQIDGPVLHVRLNRPAKRNAVNLLMTSEWEMVNAWLAGHPAIRVVTVSGNGQTFCAGDDVPEVGTLPIEEARELSYRQARMYLAWEQLPQIFVAVIDGPALGGGCVAACACDFRIASHQATFGMPEVLLGWPPGYGIAQLTALVGKARALEMCLLGRPMVAQQAYEYGLVTKLTSRNQLQAVTQEYVASLLQLPTQALRETKRLVHQDEGLQVKSAYLADTSAYIACLATEEAKQGIAAFQQKRKLS